MSARRFFTPELCALEKVIGERINANSFGVISDLKAVFAPHKTGEHKWSRISTSGRLGLCSYNAYLHDVSVYVFEDGSQPKEKRHSVRFRVGTLDDGSWGAFSAHFSKEESIDLAARLAVILDDLAELPTEEELNEMLRPFGLFGVFEP